MPNKDNLTHSELQQALYTKIVAHLKNRNLSGQVTVNIEPEIKTVAVIIDANPTEMLAVTLECEILSIVNQFGCSLGSFRFPSQSEGYTYNR